MYTEDYDKIIAIATEIHHQCEEQGEGHNFLYAFEQRLREMRAEQKANTVSTADPCAEPIRVIHYCDCRTHDPEDDSIITGEKGCRTCGGEGTWEEVPVQLIDGECDRQEFYVRIDAEYFVAMSGSDGWGERQKYVWELDKDGERLYKNDLNNPGKGIYWMRWEECLD